MSVRTRARRAVDAAQRAAGRRRRVRFYRQFIRPGDLVFDIGANIGGSTAVFVQLGARVVAVEPQHALVERTDPTPPPPARPLLAATPVAIRVAPRRQPYRRAIYATPPTRLACRCRRPSIAPTSR